MLMKERHLLLPCRISEVVVRTTYTKETGMAFWQPVPMFNYN
jgi:hypothetical protein